MVAGPGTPGVADAVAYLNRSEKMAENGAFWAGQERHFSVLGGGLLNASDGSDSLYVG
jgi:hypothetical protein